MSEADKRSTHTDALETLGFDVHVKRKAGEPS